jgi:hypothetical protein
LKKVTRYTYDIINNFDELRKQVRAVELELEISGASKPENTATHQLVSVYSFRATINCISSLPATETTPGLNPDSDLYLIELLT